MFYFKNHSAKNKKTLTVLIKSIYILVTFVLVTGSIFYYSYSLPVVNQSKSVSGKIDKLAENSLKDLSIDSGLLDNTVVKNNNVQDSAKLIEDSEKYSELSFIVEENIKNMIEKEENAEIIKDALPDTLSNDNKTIEPSAPEEVEEILNGDDASQTGTKIIIKYKDESEALKILEQNSSVLSGSQVQLLDKNLMSVQLPESVSVDEAIDYFSQREDIVNVEQDYAVEALYLPNDTYYNDSQWNLKAIKADLGWDINDGGSSDVVVAVIDTGVAYENYGAYAKATDFNASTFIAGYDFVNNDVHPNDDHGHGTHVAGTIAQSTNNGFGCAGIAYNVRVMPLKVLNNYGSGSYSNVIAAIYYAVDNGANVINMSLGGGSYLSSVHDAIKYAKDHNVIIVCAAGNSNSSVIYPAAYPESVAVGSVNSSLNKSSFSCYGPEIDFVAPGESILQETLIGSGNYYTSFYYYSGTSMASPHVAALAALILSQNPALGTADVEDLIKNGCRDLGAAGFDNSYGHGLINVYNTLVTISKPYLTTIDTNGVLPVAGQDTVIINGLNFGPGNTPGVESYVMIGALKLLSNDNTAIASWSDNQIIINLPEAAIPSSLYVAVGTNKSNLLSLDVNNAPSLTFVSPSANISTNARVFLDWIITDPNNDIVTTKLFYDTDAMGYDGTRIGPDFSIGLSSYVWDTSLITEGTYYLYATYQDEHGATKSSYMSSTITVDPAYTVDNLSLYTHTESGWKYSISAITGWTNLSFDDSVWKDAVNTEYNNKASYLPSNLFAGRIGPEAKWISGTESKSRFYFRKVVFLDSASVKNAKVKITAVGSFKLYVNGTYIGSGSKWKTLYEFDISGHAVPGLNVVCAEVSSTSNSKGFTAGIFLNEKNPQIMTADPAHPVAGTDSVTIAGADFGTGNISGFESYVMIGALKLLSTDTALITSWSDNQIVINLPLAAKPSNLYVAVGFNKSNTIGLDVNNAPSLAFVSPSASITANTGAFLDWTVTDANNDTVTTKLFYDTDAAGYNGTQIGPDFSSGVSSYVWDTSLIPAATYYVYATYQDEHGATKSSYMSSTITVDPAYTVDNLSLYTHTESGWKYSISAITGWMNLSFDDSGWKDAVNTKYNNKSSYLPSNLFAGRIGPEAKWISGTESKSRYYFRKTVFLDSESVKNAKVKITAVGSFKLYVNGTYIGSGSKWKTLYEFDISSYAVPGLNVVCAEVSSTSNSKGFTAGIFLNETTEQAINPENILREELILDINAPKINIFCINNDETETVLENSTLKIEATDDITASDNLKIRVRNEDQAWPDAESGWEAFSRTKKWALSAGAGEKTIFIEVMDESKNIAAAQDNITKAIAIIPIEDPESEVPDSAPGYGDEETIIIITGIENDTLPKAEKVWNWDAGEIGLGLLFRYCVDQDPNGLPEGEYSKVTTASISGVSGDFYLHVQAKDIAGNLSEVFTVSAILDNSAQDI